MNSTPTHSHTFDTGVPALRISAATPEPPAAQESGSSFDEVAGNYEEALQKGLRVSGENAEFFASYRVVWLKRRMKELGITVGASKAIDFGCGTGNSIQHLQRTFGFANLVGLDTSSESLRIADVRYRGLNVVLDSPISFQPEGDADLVYCNGVFHHIPPRERTAAFAMIVASLKRGGVFAFWENNPWNPGTRLVMSRIPFDRDAITMTIPESKRSIEKAGLEVRCVDSCFYFPRSLSWFRGLEPGLCKIPLGAQYLILAQKP